MSALTFTLNGINYGAAPYNVQVMDYHMPFVGKPVLYERKKADADGSVVQGTSVEPIRFTLECACKYSNTASPATTLDAIAEKLELTVGSSVTLVVSWFTGKTWTVRLASEFAPKAALNGAFFTLEFVVPSGGES